MNTVHVGRKKWAFLDGRQNYFRDVDEPDPAEAIGSSITDPLPRPSNSRSSSACQGSRP